MLSLFQEIVLVLGESNGKAPRFLYRILLQVERGETMKKTQQLPTQLNQTQPPSIIDNENQSAIYHFAALLGKPCIPTLAVAAAIDSTEILF